MKYASDVNILSREDQIALFDDLTDENRAILLESNQRLVFSEVMKMVPYTHWFYQDAVQEGMLGLVYAMDRFDPTKGFAFSTYACTYIRGYVKKAIKKSSRNTFCSLDKSLGDEGSTTMVNYVGSEKESPEKALALADEVANMRRLIDNLKPIERDAMNLYYNFDSGQQSTFEAVGKQIGRTKQGTRSIVNRAIRKITAAAGR